MLETTSQFWRNILPFIGGNRMIDFYIESHSLDCNKIWLILILNVSEKVAYSKVNIIRVYWIQNFKPSRLYMNALRISVSWPASC